jgi:hypothetical protein
MVTKLTPWTIYVRAAMSDERPTRSGYEEYSHLGGKDKEKKCVF